MFFSLIWLLFFIFDNILTQINEIMKSKLLSISEIKVLTRENQKQVFGGVLEPEDLSKCGCDCTGSVTGPFYCRRHIYCPQVYTCSE